MLSAGDDILIALCFDFVIRAELSQVPAAGTLALVKPRKEMDVKENGPYIENMGNSNSEVGQH